MTAPPILSRLLALDYLRGFFIIVIVIDHLWRWPSIFEGITGRGQSWVSAAEGFVIISGLLVGYIRGYKDRALPLSVVSRKLLRRALLLYIWFVIMTLAYSAAIWYLPTVSPMPWVVITKGDWIKLIVSTLILNNAHIWVYFLYMYAIFLALTPIAVWLFRRGAAYMVVLIIVIGCIAGQLVDIEWMQWLPVFFLPAVAGYYFPSIQKWWQHLAVPARRWQLVGLWSVTTFVLVGSVICMYFIPQNPIAEYLNDIFSKEDSLTVWRIVVSFICFVAFALLFHRLLPWLQRWSGWLLLPFGTRSLTAYISHGSIVCLLALLFVDRTNIWYNTALGITAIMGTWLIMRAPAVQRLLPR